ncbi:MAG: gliding motility-associated C-terminal domain-containing protein [Flavobacteriales bacterium]|jgi:gliding motility-associated-like protein
MKLFASVISCFIISITVTAQKEANVWHFGYGYGLDFNSGEAVQITGSMYSNEGCTAYSDSTGNLLFYSNGGGRVPDSGQDPGHIWNRNHEVMYDMQGLEGGGFSAAQSSVIIPSPGEPNTYYLFTVDEVEHYIDATPEILALQPNGRGFRYFKIDMSLNNGLGEVVEADVPLYDYSFEGLCAIRHANGTDYWILINQGTVGIGVYSVTSEGVTLSSVFETDTPQTGIIKASPIAGNPLFPCCSKVAISSGQLLEFDLNTGILSDPEQLPFIGSEAFEFSHNSQYLYATSTGLGTGTQQLVRYNLVSAFEQGISVASTQEVIAPDITAYYMQMAPDMNIYYTWFDFLGTSHLGAINCANSDSPTVTPQAFSYNNGFDLLFFSLPNFPSWIFYDPYTDFIEFGPDTVYLCEGDSLILDAGVGDYWEWGGDCFSGPESTWPDNNTRYFTVTQPGTYVACVNGPCSNGSGADGCDSSDQITVLPCPADEPACDLLNLPETLDVCAGDTLQLEADLSQITSYSGLQWSGGGTFIPSNTVAQPLYIPSPQEVNAGFANLTLQVFIQANNTVGGNFLAYDHSGDDIIFYTNTVDGSTNIIQSNTGNDWTAMGFRTATNTLYGISNIVTAPALSSVDINTGTVTPIFSYTNNQFYAGDYDNVNNLFYVIGIPEINSGEPLVQTLYTIDVNNGALTTIGDLNLLAIDNFFFAGDDGINGLAYDPSLNVLWATTANGALYEINTNTAEALSVGSTVADLRGLAYDYNANELWGIDAGGTLYHIDKFTGDLIEQVLSQEPLGFVTTLTYALPTNGPETICSDNTNIVIHNGNTLDLGDDVIICEGETIVLSAPGFDSSTWQDGSISESYTVDESGTYSVNVVDLNGCLFSDSITVIVNEAPIAEFIANPQPATIENTEITFTSTSTGNPSTYNWSFELGIPNASVEQNPVINFPAVPGNYAVSLIVENQNGCIDTLSAFIQIDGAGNLTLPNIFTPNGDGQNDRFLPFEEFPGKWQLTIFNRWGAEVFTTSSVALGWNGEDCISGTYYWIIEPLEGQQGEGKSGFVMLLRD